MLSASANKLSKLKEQAAEYASLIMEELDPENFGYIEVKIKSFNPLQKKKTTKTFVLEGKKRNSNSSDPDIGLCDV